MGKVTALVKKIPLLRILARELIFFYKRIKYNRVSKNTPVCDKTVLFCAFGGKSVSCSPKAIYQFMKTSEEYADYSFIWILENPDNFHFLKDNRTSLVKANTLDAWKAYASTSYWFCNFNIPDYIYPKKEQTYAQCWHGTPLKRLGYDINKTDNAMNGKFETRRRYRLDANKFNYLLSPSPFCTEIFASAWNLTKRGMANKILEVGYPRNDSLFDVDIEQVSKIKRHILGETQKKIILYAPTWRDNQYNLQTGYTYHNEVDWDYLRNQLEDQYIVLFRAHYLISKDFDFNKYEGFIYDVSDYPDVNDLYLISDMLITDYSSVFFDYANLKKPMCFYMYDLDNYMCNIRGFYVGLEELPGPIVKTENELVQKIKEMYIPENYDTFVKKYNCLDDGKASKRFTEKVIAGK